MKTQVVYLITSLRRGGPTNVLFNMLEAYSLDDGIKDKVNITILTLINELEDSRKIDFEKIGIKVETMGFPSRLYALWHKKTIKERLCQMNTDICHSIGLITDVILYKIQSKGIIKVSSIYSNTFQDNMMQFGTIKGYMLARTQMYCTKHFQSVVTCSNFIADSLKKYNLPLSIIYTGVNSNYFVPITDAALKNEKKKILGIPQNKIILIYIARMIPRKNPAFLIQAFKEQKNKNLFLLMMGNGEEMEKCKKILNDTKKVLYLGEKPGTLDYLQVSDYYISTSLSEGFPTAVLEALSTELVPILSDILPHTEMVNDLSCSHIFSMSNTVDLINTLNNLDTNNYGKECRDYLINNFSSQVMLSKHIQLYGLLTGRNLNN